MPDGGECQRQADTPGPAAETASPGLTDAQQRRLDDAIEEFELRRESEPDLSIEDFSTGYGELRPRLLKLLQLVDGFSELDDGSRARRRVPRRLGRYVILDELGQGGAATVFRAYDPKLNRHVALKVLSLEGLESSVGSEERFLREARALGQLSHPSVVRVFDVGVEDPWCWMSMELMEGSLADELDARGSSPLDAQGVRDVVAKVAAAAEGLAHAHARGILHRDVKPSNLLFDGDGQVLVGDFGLASIAGEEGLTRTGLGVGTPGYASPEQMQGHPADTRSDVHGLGVTLFVLLSGRSPSTLPPEPAWLSCVPPALRAIVLRATATNPNKRHPDARALVGELRAWLDGRPTSRSLRRRRIGAAVTACVALLAVASLSWWHRWQRPLRGGYLVMHGDRASDGVNQTLRSRLVFATPDHPGGTTAVTLDPPWADYRFELRHGWLFSDVVVTSRGKALARFRLEPETFVTPRDWAFVIQPEDLDGDHVPEAILAGESGGISAIKWDPEVLGGPSQGWRVSVPGRFQEGSPNIADWDDDGTAELLVGTSGGWGGSEGGAMLALDLKDGSIKQAVPLTRGVLSTPRLMEGPDGEVLATYLDTVAVRNGQGASLLRFLPNATHAPDERRYPDAGHLTWPVFQDVDGDGEHEVIVGVATHRIECLRQDLRGPPVWVHDLDHGPSYLALSDQDGDGREEVCACTMGTCFAIRTDAGLTRESRIVWRVPIGAKERVSHQPVAIGDHTGDGVSEIAVGTSDGRIVVLSAQHAQPLWTFEPETSLRHLALGPKDIIGRLAVLRGPGDDEVTVVAATVNGWALAQVLPPRQATPDWMCWLGGGDTVASPVVVRSTTADGAVQERLLAAGAAGRRVTLAAPPTPGMRPFAEEHWTFQTKSWVKSTPAVSLRDGENWAYFTDEAGHVYGLPLRDAADGRE